MAKNPPATTAAESDQTAAEVMAEAKRNIEAVFPDATFEEVTLTKEEVPPEIFRFELFGDQITGQYVRKAKVEFPDGKDAVGYVLKTTSGALYQFVGNGDLNPKMAKVRPGQTVRVTYVEDKEMGGALSAQKVFRLEAAKTSAGASGERAPNKVA